MPKSCIICSAVASLDLQLPKACQRKDWKKQHKKICKLLNVGHGGSWRHAGAAPVHTNQSNLSKKNFEIEERSLSEEDGKRFFKLFQESTFEGSQAPTYESQLILAKQLIAHGANVNAVSSPNAQTCTVHAMRPS
jgi:hypothetical protein